MLHISGIEERRLLWDHIKSSEWLRNVCDHFLSEYIRLHHIRSVLINMHSFIWNGTNRLSHLLLQTHRDELTTAYSHTITEDMWTTLVTFNAMQTIMSHIIPPTYADHMQSTVSTLSEDDDVALLRLGGWALFSCIQYRKNALKNKSRTKHTEEKLKAYKAELNILEALVDDKKVGLPSAITAQDLGYMTFPSPSMMPFIRELNKKIKECVNSFSYANHGSKLFDVSHHNKLKFLHELCISF